MKKRLMATLLALVMALGLCVTTAWAEDVTELTMSNLGGYKKFEANKGGDYYELPSGTYRLGEDLSLGFTLYILANQEVVLDLNGHSIFNKLANTAPNTIVLKDNSKFTLKDTSSGTDGVIKAPTDTNYHSIALSGDNITFYMLGGSVETIGFSYSYSAGNGPKMIADGGSVTGEIQVKAKCTITATSSVSGTSFNSVTSLGIISGGEFRGKVYNKGTIKAGTFLDEVTNHGTISGGTFNGSVTNSGTIKGGTFYGTVSGSGKIDNAACWKVTFGGTEISDAYVLKGSQKLTKPDDPVKEGYTFDGWYTDADCTAGNEYDFDTSVTEELTLYAKWTKDPVEETPTTPTRPSTTRPTTTTNANTTVSSAKTGDVSMALYGALALTSLLGMGYVGKKR